MGDFLKGKRGADLIFPIVIFVVFNIMFFSLIMVFTQRTASEGFIYEELFSKKIGLMLNRAEPGMELRIEMTQFVKEVYREKDLQWIDKNLVNIYEDKGLVVVRAGGKAGKEFRFFSKIKLDREKEIDEEITGLYVKTGIHGEITWAEYIIYVE